MANKLPHEELMEEEGLSYNSLPSDILEEIQELDDLKKEYNEFPSEKGLKVITTESIKIADSIQDFIENGLDESEDEEGNDGDNKDGDKSKIINEVSSTNNQNNNEENSPTWRFWM